MSKSSWQTYQNHKALRSKLLEKKLSVFECEQKIKDGCLDNVNELRVLDVVFNNFKNKVLVSQKVLKET